MKKIGLLSDTHSYLHPKIFEYFLECDEIWHAGDVGNASIIDELAKFKPVRAVYGNIDGQEIRKICPKKSTLQVRRSRCLDNTYWRLSK